MSGTDPIIQNPFHYSVHCSCIWDWQCREFLPRCTFCTSITNKHDVLQKTFWTYMRLIYMRYNR